MQTPPDFGGSIGGARFTVEEELTGGFGGVGRGLHMLLREKRDEAALGDTETCWDWGAVDGVRARDPPESRVLLNGVWFVCACGRR
jgi:hypothetical protein